MEIALEPGTVDHEERVIGHAEADAVPERANRGAAPDEASPHRPYTHRARRRAARGPDAREEEGKQDEARERQGAQKKERRAPAVALDDVADQGDADERASRPRELDQAYRHAAPLPAHPRADIRLERGIEAALADPGQRQGHEHRGVKRQCRGREHAGGEAGQPEQHHGARTPAVGQRTQERAQESHALVDGDQRGHPGQRHLEPARQGRRERIREKYQVDLDGIRSECMTITIASEGPPRIQTLTPDEMGASGAATDWAAVAEQVAALQKRIDEIGPVNLVAIEWAG